jgi:dephospho-CoA kinase
MLILGLTGSIGMGKSTTAAMFRAEGTPVHDSDASVHELYKGGAVPIIAQHFPDAVVDGSVDRGKLAAAVLGKPNQLSLLEQLIHPLVGQQRERFLAINRRAGTKLVVVDIPLLFEIGGERDVDIIVVSSAPDEVQEQRVLARSNMTREKFLAIKAKQTPNTEKCRRAHVIIDTGRGMDTARAQVRALLRSLASTG